MLTRTFQWTVLVLCLGIVVGCKDKETEKKNGDPTQKKKDEHADPHDIPLTDEEKEQLKKETSTWSAAIEHIKKYRDIIQKETTGGIPAKAHRSLDLLEEVLKWLPEVAKKNVHKDHWQTIGENTQILRISFNEVHANIDAAKDPDYKSVADAIDKAVKALTAIKVGDGTKKK